MEFVFPSILEEEMVLVGGRREGRTGEEGR